MRTGITALLAFQIAICTAQPGPGQEAPAGARGGAQAGNRRPAAQQGPLVLPDGRVTFRLNAPKASEVILSSELWKITNHTEPLKKDDQGLWSLTVGPLAPGFYDYFFIVDGVAFPDPGNGNVKPARTSVQSELEVPGAEANWEAVRNVPHGDVRVIWYYSKSLSKMRRMHVYTPPGFEASRDRYPVLYLAHGDGDTDEVWTRIGRASLILDNLVADGKAKPMIIVTPFIFAAEPGSADLPRNSELFAKDLFEDVIPYMEKNLRALPGSANRAFGGLALSTNRALEGIPGNNTLADILMTNMDKFDYFVFTSAGGAWDVPTYEKKYPGVLDNPANIKRVKILVSDGTANNNFARNKRFVEGMKERGYTTFFTVHDGIHGWHEFRLDLYDEAQKLFR